MELLGIGLPEIILILIVGLMVVGPKRLPELAARIARLIREMRGYASDVTEQMRAELDELSREYERMRSELDEVREDARKDVESMTVEVDRTVREAPAIIESSAEPPPKTRRDGGEQPTADDAS